ncbi:hypothetical protein [Pseudonocardia broussonetiae]|uniref:DUF3817 domain-containing protein n=1 Tax=Pseudonocardia broussonetiae TaxID=2736640 RepID=A0A6M6JT20_9PSEU|nr:hypothetical protein [Pseudonocardia broussonetiae]QJY50236.1 hypothetical protein HOP40_34510 [Pseudonocardia broussonetiae]
MRLLAVAAVVEAVSLVVLLANRLTVHLDPVTSVTGPVHGTAYLVVIGAVLLVPGASRTARLLALVPGVGGALALRRLRGDAATAGSATPGRGSRAGR